MKAFKSRWIIGVSWLTRLYAAYVVLVLVTCESVIAEACQSPTTPFVPSDPQAIQDYANVIEQDFARYFREMQSFFRCWDVERTRAFEEAHMVTEEYRRFLRTLSE